MNAKLLVLAIPLLTACGGSFPLARSVTAPYGASVEQQQLADWACKEHARNEANTPGRWLAVGLLRETIIGAPIAYQITKQHHREAYAECMRGRGYTVVPADDSQ